MTNGNPTRSVVNQNALPENYPTHLHEAYFWECLGRTVATFGFLEEVLTKAVFAFSATTKYSEEEIEQAYAQWFPQLEKSLSDQLGGLIDRYGKAVRDNSDATIENLEDLITDLREASKIRNVLCHGSWRTPSQNGASIPFYVNRQKERFETPIDVSFLNKVQKHTVELICVVINSVTHMGWQFPGSFGPGEVIWSM
jgi:uncharacterized protein (DUF2132 family)